MLAKVIVKQMQTNTHTHTDTHSLCLRCWGRLESSWNGNIRKMIRETESNERRRSETRKKEDSVSGGDGTQCAICVIQRYLEIVLLVLARCWQPSVHLFFRLLLFFHLFIRRIASMKACIRVIFAQTNMWETESKMENGMEWADDIEIRTNTQRVEKNQSRVYKSRKCFGAATKSTNAKRSASIR